MILYCRRIIIMFEILHTDGVIMRHIRLVYFHGITNIRKHRRNFKKIYILVIFVLIPSSSVVKRTFAERTKKLRLSFDINIYIFFFSRKIYNLYIICTIRIFLNVYIKKRVKIHFEASRITLIYS